MGALIKTKGTKKLAAHFNDEFDTYMPFWRAQQAAAPGALFSTAGGRNVDLGAITLATTDATPGHSRRADMLVLLPDIHGHPVHAHLEQRWLWFLNLANVGAGALTQANHNKIAKGIFHALTDTTPGPPPQPKWDCIVFDAVESGDTQDVALAVHRVDGRRVIEITLITPPISAVAGPGGLPALDP
jgi:hypothetical protein